MAPLCVLCALRGGYLRGCRHPAARRDHATL